MHSKRGFNRFEFYFVVVVISLIVFIGAQHYVRMAEQVQCFSFEVLAQNFKTAVFNARAQWFIRQQEKVNRNIITLAGVNILMSEQGWPLTLADEEILAINRDDKTRMQSGLTEQVGVESCKQLWLHLLQDPKPISYAGGDPLGSHPYHLSLTAAGDCRYQLYAANSIQYYFDYSPKTGQVIIHMPIDAKK